MALRIGPRNFQRLLVHAVSVGPSYSRQGRDSEPVHVSKKSAVGRYNLGRLMIPKIHTPSFP